MPYKSAQALDKLTDQIEQAESLDAVSTPVATAVGKLLKSRRLTDLLSGTPIGHPLHPLLVTIPIGSWAAASVLDLMRQPKAAQTLVGLGVVSVAPAALSGVSDWRGTVSGEQRIGIIHGLLNTTVVALYGASWLARRRGRGLLGVLLTVPAGALLTASGWLGGHLSYALGVGVDTTAMQQLTVDWTDAAAASDVTVGGLLQADVADVPVLLSRLTDGTVVAYVDRCTHRGGPLHEGTIVDGCVECPWHGSRFELSDGTVAQGPATRPQPRYEVREVDGRIQVRREEVRALRANPVGT